MCRRTAASTGVGLSIAAFSARACSSAPGGGNGMTLDGMLFFWLKVVTVMTLNRLWSRGS